MHTSAATVLYCRYTVYINIHSFIQRYFIELQNCLQYDIILPKKNIFLGFFDYINDDIPTDSLEQ